MRSDFEAYEDPHKTYVPVFSFSVDYEGKIYSLLNGKQVARFRMDPQNKGAVTITK